MRPTEPANLALKHNYLINLKNALISLRYVVFCYRDDNDDDDDDILKKSISQNESVQEKAVFHLTDLYGQTASH